jgi:hypothetical protein
MALPGKAHGAWRRKRILFLLRWVAVARALLGTGDDTPVIASGACRCEVVLLGFSRGTRSLGAAVGWMAEAAIFVAGDGRPEDGGGGSFDLPPCPSGEMGRRGSRLWLRKA